MIELLFLIFLIMQFVGILLALLIIPFCVMYVLWETLVRHR